MTKRQSGSITGSSSSVRRNLFGTVPMLGGAVKIFSIKLPA
jgi:hypothetical protein